MYKMKQNNHIIALRMPVPLYEKVKAKADAEGSPVATVIKRYVAEAFI
jgi:predicted DNA binding CopG/RHH family protein